MICEIKHYQQLTVDELYRVIQLRIQGFIVENKVCYQDLEDKYDKHQYYMMWYENGEMIGVNALCYKKKFKGDDGTIYEYFNGKLATVIKGETQIRMDNYTLD